MTRGHVPGGDLAQLRVLQTLLLCVGAARPEAAALRQLARVGGPPGIGVASPRSPPITGSESSRRFVYGCCGAAKTASTGPVSTIRPAYMTAIRSQVSASTPRSWEIRISASPSSSRSRSSSCSTCACMTTSRAVVGSSAITSDGPAGERQGDHHPLALAAGELMRIAAPDTRRSARPSPAARRSARCDLRDPALGSCSRIASAIWVSILWTGSSEFIAPWKTSEMCRQRTSCIPSSVRRPMLIGSSTPRAGAA